MKLALCLFKYFPYGGMQRDFLRIAIQLAKKNSVDVFTTAWQGEIPEGITVHMVQVTGWTNHRRMQNFSKKILEQTKRSNYELIVGFNKMPGLDVYFAADICYVKQVRENYGWLYRLTPRYWSYSLLEKSIFSPEKQTKILVLSEKQQANYQQIYHTPKERFYLLPVEFSRRNPNLIDKAAIRRSHGINADEYLVLMVCSAFKTKGVDRALHALSKLRLPLQEKIHFLVIGDDRAEPFLRLAKRLKIKAKIQFLGGRKDVPDYMCAADLFLHPAHKEAGGKVLIEAMSCGVPIITTFECGHAEHVIKADAGIVVPQKYMDDVVLANSIANVLTASDATKTNWKKQGLAYAANYPIVDFAEATANIIETLWRCVKKS